MDEGNFNRRGHHPQQGFPGGEAPWSGPVDMIGKVEGAGVDQFGRVAGAIGQFPQDIIRSLPVPGMDPGSEEDEKKKLQELEDEYVKGNYPHPHHRHQFPHDDPYKDIMKGLPVPGGDEKKTLQELEDEYLKEASDDHEGNYPHPHHRHQFSRDDPYKDYAKGGNSGSAKDDSKAEGQTQNASKKAEGEDEVDNYKKQIEEMEEEYTKEAGDAEDDDGGDYETQEKHNQRGPKWPHDHLYKDYVKGGNSGSAKDDSKAEGQTQNTSKNAEAEDEVGKYNRQLEEMEKKYTNEVGDDDDDDDEEDGGDHDSQEKHNQRGPKWPQDHPYKGVPRRGGAS